MKKNPKQALKDNTDEVRNWPSYLRTYLEKYEQS